MESRQDRDVERPDADREDLRGNEVWDGEPAYGPCDCVDENCYDGGFARCLRGRAVCDFLGGHLACDSEIGSDEGQGKDLHGDASHEGPPATDEVNDEDCNEKCRDELDDRVYASCEESGETSQHLGFERMNRAVRLT